MDSSANLSMSPLSALKGAQYIVVEVAAHEPAYFPPDSVKFTLVS